MRYMQSYRFIFASPNWMTNVLLGALAVLSTQVIPVVGQLILIGYLFEVIDHFHYHHNRKDPETDHYPDLNLNRMMDYLVRGAWPMLAQIVCMLPVVFVAMVVLFMGFIVAGIVGEQFGGAFALIIFVLMFFVYISILFAANVFVIPIYLRAGIARDFGSAFSLTFVKDFLSRVGKEAFLTQLFLLSTNLVLFFVGMLACFIGVFPALAIAFMAAHYLDYELYELYLERGGTPIEAPRAVGGTP
jgi:hypothetical protein